MELIFGGTGSGKSAFGEERATGFSGRKLYLATMVPYGTMAEERIARHRRMRQGKGFETVECSLDVGAVTFPPLGDSRNPLGSLGDSLHSLNSLDSLRDSLRDSSKNSMDSLRDSNCDSVDSVILLECVGTLLANEMYAPSAVNWDLLPPEGESERKSERESERKSEEESESKSRANQSDPEEIEAQVEEMMSPVVEKIFSDILTLSQRCTHLIVISGDIFQELGGSSLETQCYVQGLGRLNRKLAEVSTCVTEMVYGVPILWKGGDEKSGTGDKT